MAARSDMILTRAADNGIRLQSGDTVLLVDPESNRGRADVVLRTTSTLEDGTKPGNEISFPGEYEAGGIEIRGFEMKGGGKDIRTAYSILFEDIRFLVIGASVSQPDAAHPLDCDAADVVIVPAATSAFPAAAIAALARDMSAALVVAPFSSPNDAAKTFGVKPDTEDKIVFRKKDLHPSAGRVVVLKTS